MLGVPVETFRGNKLVMIIWALIAAGVAWGYAEFGMYDSLGWNVFIGTIVAFALFYAYWLSTVEIVIYDGGISSKTFRGERQMRWEDVAKFTYSATKQSVNFIPVGTYYHLKLEDAQGKTMKFGNRAGNMEGLSNHMIQRTLPPLVSRAVDQYNNGAELDFGAIKFSRAAGFKGKGFFGLGKVDLPLDQVADYRIESGAFYVYRQGKRMPALNAEIGQVPNAFALLALLDSIFRREQATS